MDSFKAHNEPIMGVSLHFNNPNSLFACSQDGFVRFVGFKKSEWAYLGDNRTWKKEWWSFIQTNFDGVAISGGADSLLKLYAPIKWLLIK